MDYTLVVHYLCGLLIVLLTISLFCKLREIRDAVAWESLAEERRFNWMRDNPYTCIGESLVARALVYDCIQAHKNSMRSFFCGYGVENNLRIKELQKVLDEDPGGPDDRPRKLLPLTRPPFGGCFLFIQKYFAFSLLFATILATPGWRNW